MAKKKFKIPILAAAGTAGTVLYAYSAYKSGGTNGLVHALTGMTADGKFILHDAIVTYTPMAAGIAGTMIARKTGVSSIVSSTIGKLIPVTA